MHFDRTACIWRHIMSEAILWGIRAGEYGDLDRSDVAEYHHVLLASMK